jgi:hypothetical protein
MKKIMVVVGLFFVWGIANCEIYPSSDVPNGYNFGIPRGLNSLSVTNGRETPCGN